MLVELRAEMFHAMGVDASGAWRQNAREWFSQRVGTPGVGIFVVEDSGHVVACAMGAIRDAAPSPSVPEGRDVLLSNVCTLPQWRGRGHGRRAFDAVMAWARDTGVGRVELMATADGRGMYERAGFVVNASPAMRMRL